MSTNLRSHVDSERALGFRTAGRQRGDEQEDVGQDDEEKVLQSQRTILEANKDLLEKIYTRVIFAPSYNVSEIKLFTSF